jgi:hypothetical protein
MGGGSSAYRVLVGKREGKIPFGILWRGWRIILKYIFEKKYGRF